MFNLKGNSMKLNCMFLAGLMLFIGGCTQVEVGEIENVSKQNEVATKSGGDGKYDLLGYGYDITGKYYHPQSARAKVVDIERFIKDNPGRLDSNIYGEDETKVIIGTHSFDYLKKLSPSLDFGSAAVAFPFELTGTFSTESTKSGDDAFCGFYKKITKKNIYLNADYKILRNYLTKEFIEDVKRYSQPATYNNMVNLFKRYGTHVLVDITLGGRLSLVYKTTNRETEEKRESSVHAGFSKFISSILRLNIGGSTSTSLIEKNTNQQLAYYTLGGDSSKGLIDKINLPTSSSNENQLYLNINNWQNSCTVNNAVLIDSKSPIFINNFIDNVDIPGDDKFIYTLSLMVYLKEASVNTTAY